MTALIVAAELIGFVSLTAGTAFFVAAEFSLTALERTTVDGAVRDGLRGAGAVAKAHRRLSFYLSGAQFGITLTTLVTGYLSEPILAEGMRPLVTSVGLAPGTAHALSVPLAIFIATSMSMVYGELVPKNIALAKPLATARLTTGFVVAFTSILSLGIRGLDRTSNALVRRLGIEPMQELRAGRSVDELGRLVRASAQRGSLDDPTADLVARSLRFGERTAEEMMTPRVTIETLSIDQTAADLLTVSAATGFSRFPVVDRDLDNTVGLVHVKQALSVPPHRRANTPLRHLARQIPRVPDSLDGDEVLRRVRAHGMQAALVVDEYGGAAGLVTMEDLIEEIVGEVRDEYDADEIGIEPRGDGWVCSGLIRVDELYEATGYLAPDGEYETLGGLVMHQLGRVPSEGDIVDLPSRGTAGDGSNNVDNEDLRDTRGWTATIERMDQRRVDLVFVEPRGGHE